MTLDWNVRRELLDFAHRWPYVFFAFLLGSLLGWAAAFAVPAPYRAEYDLYVAYNADAIYRNPDDYKNWQLGELELYIHSDEILQGALDGLQSKYAGWDAVQLEQVRPALHTYWRNAGKWRLVAEWDNPEQTSQLVQAWGESVLDQAHAAIQQGQQALFLGDQARALARDQAHLKQHMLVISETQRSLTHWLDETSQAADSQPLETLDRWRLLSLAAGLAAGLVAENPAGSELLQRFPAQGAAIDGYREWTEQALVVAQVEQAALKNQARELDLLHADQVQRWEAATKAARNLTVDLTIERISETSPDAFPLHPVGQLAIVGGVLGLLVWAFVWLAMPAMRRPR